MIDPNFNSFVSEMIRVMEAHESTKGDDWKSAEDYELVDNLMSEIHEFEIKNDPDYELIDIANCCFILWAKRKFYK